MSEILRRSGLEVVGDVPWGTHFCQFYQTPADLLDVLVPYFTAGLQQNEFCMWITSEPLGAEAARAAMTAALPDFESHVRRGQIEIMPHTRWYLKGGAFDPGPVLESWVEKHDQALAAGYDGLRLTGNTFWLEKRDWAAFTEYEAAIDGVIGRYKMLAVCTYAAGRCGIDEILDVVRNHRFALVRREGRWELIESAERKHAEASLRESREKFRALVESSSDFIWEMDARGRYTYCSPQMEKLWGMRPEGMIGRSPFDMMPAGHKDEAAKAFATLAASPRPFEGLESTAHDASGRLIHIETSGVPFFDDSGRLLGFRGVSRDVTARKQAEERLARDLDAMGRLQRLGTLVLREGRLGPVLDSVVETAMAIADADFGNIQLVDRKTGDLRIVAHRGFPAWWIEFWDHVGEGRGACGTALERGQRVIIGDVETSPIFAGRPELDIQRRAGVRAVQSTPLISRSGRRVGMFSTHFRRPHTPDDRTLRLLDLLARQAADIIEWTQAEEDHRESEARFRAIASSTPDHLLVQDRDLRYTYVLNPQMNLTEKDMIGKTDNDFLDKEDADKLTAIKRRVLETGQAVHVEAPLVSRDGTAQYFEGSYVPKFDAQGRVDGLIGYFQNVTDRKKAEALAGALAEQERLRLGAAVEQSSDSVVMIDLDGTIRYVNAAFESINRTPRAEALKRSYFDLFAGDTLAGAIREATSSGRVWHGHVERSVPGAKPVELEITASPACDPTSAVIGILVTERDVTQENALQRQLRQSQKMEALGTLAGGISHDFNNILGAIIVNTELAQLDLGSSQPGREPLSAVLHAATRGKELVKQIITFSRQAEWERRIVEAGLVVRETMAFLRPALPGNVTVHEVVADAPMSVLGDPSQIHQIVVNLCQNAVMAMAERGGELKVGLAPVDVDAAMAAQNPLIRPGPYVCLTVSDTGHGMSREVRERIFEPFFTTRRPGSGSGLGLSVVHGIVRSYKGTITVDSEPGRGSEFNIYFPRVAVDPPPRATTEQAQPTTGDERILLVEDETAQLASLAQGLTKLGYTVTAREESWSALDLFRQSPMSFDLVITDQTMPQMSGLDLAAELVRIRPDIPIILYTGFSEKVSSESLARSGVREFLMKPFTLLEISRLIAKALKTTA